jgi:hypothetical protein
MENETSNNPDMIFASILASGGPIFTPFQKAQLKKENVMPRTTEEFKRALLNTLKNDSEVRTALIDIFIDSYQNDAQGVHTLLNPSSNIDICEYVRNEWLRALEANSLSTFCKLPETSHPHQE